MVKTNSNYDKLAAGYLFPEIAKRTKLFQEKNPGVQVMRLGIGNTTEPLASSILKALQFGVEKLGKTETYTGYGDLAVTMRQDIAAQSGLDEALLFHTQAKGFTSDTEEALLKQSETIRLSQKQITPSLQNIKDILIYDTFGVDSEEAKHKDTLQFSFDNPAIATESERAESAARFAATVNSLKQANVPAAEALKLAKEFFKGVTISDEIIAATKERDEKRFNTEVEASQAATEASKVSAKEPKDSDKEPKASSEKPASKEKDNAKETA